jgi:hypothetical protein
MKSKLLNVVLIAGLALAVGLLIKFIFFPSKVIPAEFSESRLRGAALAQKIVVLANASLNSLSEIADYDKQGNTSEALIAISRQLMKNRELHGEAIKLSSQLEKMARSLPEIKPARARLVATEAVTSEVTLVSRLISYNDYLAQLFEVLRAKFNDTAMAANTNGRVEELIKKINDEAAAINDLDKRFNDALVEFDRLFL